MARSVMSCEIVQITGENGCGNELSYKTILCKLTPRASLMKSHGGKTSSYNYRKLKKGTDDISIERSG